MSARKQIVCDGCGQLGSTFSLMVPLSAIRKRLREMGWHTRPKSQDICPGCWEGGRR